MDCQLSPITPKFGARQLLWIGASSFEKRCLGSLRSETGVAERVRKAILLNYQTALRPQRRGEILKERNRAAIQSALKRATSPAEVHDQYIDAYSGRQLRRALAPIARESLGLVVD